MKLLSLIRHAKSSWKNPELADFERPLNKRGKRDAPVMGRRLAALDFKPDLILSSPAKRAARTAKAIADELGSSTSKIDFNEEIYEATSPAELLEVIRSLDPGLAHVALIGHNPALTELSNWLADVQIENIPTCGVVRLRLAAHRWEDVSAQGGTLLDCDYPKKGTP